MHPLTVSSTPQPHHAASHSSSHPRNITRHASQGRSMIPALFIPSVLAIRLLPFPISPPRPMSVTYIRSFHLQRHDRAIKWTVSDRRSGTSPLAVSPPRQWGGQLNQSCYLPFQAGSKQWAGKSIRQLVILDALGPRAAPVDVLCEYVGMCVVTEI